MNNPALFLQSSRSFIHLFSHSAALSFIHNHYSQALVSHMEPSALMSPFQQLLCHAAPLHGDNTTTPPVIRAKHDDTCLVCVVVTVGFFFGRLLVALWCCPISARVVGTSAVDERSEEAELCVFLHELSCPPVCLPSPSFSGSCCFTAGRLEGSVSHGFLLQSEPGAVGAQPP